MTTRWPAALLLSFALLAPQLSCQAGGEKAANASSGDQSDSEAKDKKKETAVPIEVATVGRGAIQAALKFSSNLDAERQVKVFSQAARLVRELNVEEGNRVTKNQVLIRLQDDEQRSALAKTRSQYDRAAREHERRIELRKRELISEETFSASIYEVEQLQIALEDAQRQVSYTDVRAPLSGTITNRLVNIGDQVTVGQHLFDLVDFDSLVAPIFVPEKVLARLKPGLEAKVSAQATAVADLPGHIERIAPIVDPRSGTMKVIVAIDNREGLRPGMYVEVSLITDRHEDAILIPKRALIYDKDQAFVYRLRGDERRVDRVLVQPLLADRDSIEPVDGIAVGDVIVVAGQAGLKDGALVRLPGDPEPDDADSEAAKATDGAA